MHTTCATRPFLEESTSSTTSTRSAIQSMIYQRDFWLFFKTMSQVSYLEAIFFPLAIRSLTISDLYFSFLQLIQTEICSWSLTFVWACCRRCWERFSILEWWSRRRWRAPKGTKWVLGYFPEASSMSREANQPFASFSLQSFQRLQHARQLSLKLLANVTYGYTSASFSGRMPCVEIADAIVQFGRRTLEEVSISSWFHLEIQRLSIRLTQFSLNYRPSKPSSEIQIGEQWQYMVILIVFSFIWKERRKTKPSRLETRSLRWWLLRIHIRSDSNSRRLVLSSASHKWLSDLHLTFLLSSLLRRSICLRCCWQRSVTSAGNSNRRKIKCQSSMPKESRQWEEMDSQRFNEWSNQFSKSSFRHKIFLLSSLTVNVSGARFRKVECQSKTSSSQRKSDSDLTSKSL